ncbi:large conductance mechanosensitive channel protein MscL [Microterricola viridarii]|uniref:Large-conductance mechanosensitive channel n=1 Tax=Microterricola viridarii TaxID=412690 RepID=A0A1H1YF65_9MICO|nr:large conductance mechanosensitive channel protein MscL [Microterricola viridarii]SDT20034.1 large conductance mechanosensitive channel [Microterricola viridarii]
MLKGFREFIMRGNVIDLAVAVVIGAAFTGVVNSIVANLFTPLIGAIFDAESLDEAMILPLPGGGGLKFGAVLGSIITFLIVAAVVYFVFVLPINKMKEMQEAKRKAGVEDAADVAAPVTELDLLTEIRDALVASEDKQLR